VHRANLAFRGVELFLDDPLTGVGWQRAARVFQLDSDAGAGLLFDDANPEFSTDRNPTHVHNVYIQVPAEAGLLALALFVVLVVAALRGIRFVLWQSTGDTVSYTHVRCLVAMLVAVMVWWNDSALFGAQPDAVIAATILGLLASVPLVESRRFASAEHPFVALAPHPQSVSWEPA
jgi:O-antigen ligase